MPGNGLWWFRKKRKRVGGATGQCKQAAVPGQPSCISRSPYPSLPRSPYLPPIHACSKSSGNFQRLCVCTQSRVVGLFILQSPFAKRTAQLPTRTGFPGSGGHGFEQESPDQHARCRGGARFCARIADVGCTPGTVTSVLFFCSETVKDGELSGLPCRLAASTSEQDAGW